jgi:aminoglycoside phosphotransferase family enzyme
MSWLFLPGKSVFKLKKPLRYPFLNFTSLAARKWYCSAEVRLNRRLAGKVYRGIASVRRNPHGELAIGGPGEVVDWLVEMEQLPAGDMLDRRIREGRVGTDEIVSLGEKLGQFYIASVPQLRDGGAYIAHLHKESAANRRLLMHPKCRLTLIDTEVVLDRVERLLERWTPAIKERIERGRIVEGHGDLRPEHVCVAHPTVIIDCLEFDRSMRLLDPYDEVNYLGQECEMLGASWIRPLLLSTVTGILGDPPEPRLLATYGAFRAVLRARICVAHLVDPEPRQPERWPGEAMRYLALATDECVRAGG